MSKIIFGNAKEEGTKRWGWFLGHFITPENDPRSTEALEVKWGIHKAGDHRSESDFSRHLENVILAIFSTLVFTLAILIN